MLILGSSCSREVLEICSSSLYLSSGFISSLSSSYHHHNYLFIIIMLNSLTTNVTLFSCKSIIIYNVILTLVLNALIYLLQFCETLLYAFSSSRILNMGKERHLAKFTKCKHYRQESRLDTCDLILDSTHFSIWRQCRVWGINNRWVKQLRSLILGGILFTKVSFAFTTTFLLVHTSKRAPLMWYPTPVLISALWPYIYHLRWSDLNLRNCRTEA